MYHKKRIIGIIPARGGSKGVLKKNIKPLAKKPLIAYTIEAALKSPYLDRVIVSTDNKEIAQVSKKYGIKAVKRPKNLATDQAKTISAVFHLLDVLKKEKYYPEIIVLLQPTSPLRTAEDINKAVEIFLKNKPDSVISVSESEPSFYWSFQIEKEYLKPIFSKKHLTKRRQDLPKVYTTNGAIYIISTKNLSKYNSFYGKNISPYIMPQNRNIDIDSEIDFKIAESIIKNK